MTVCICGSVEVLLQYAFGIAEEPIIYIIMPLLYSLLFFYYATKGSGDTIN